MKDPELIYGTVAEFDDPTLLLNAAFAVKERGFKKYEAYTPYPIKDLEKAIPSFNFVPPMVLGAGLTGALIAWSMQYYIAAIDYPINVGGRPLYSWPSFIPILFELSVLFAASAAFFGVFFLCGFPQPHFPLFNVPQFARATSDRLFLCIESEDPMYDDVQTPEFLGSLSPIGVWQVENS